MVGAERHASWRQSTSRQSASGHLLNALAAALAADGVETLPEERSQGFGMPADVASLSILLVDDNTINQKVGKKILKRLGSAPDIVSSGEEAIEACLSRSFDVVLMDIEMPEMDGITAAGLIRERIPAAEQPFIVALTANAMASERENYLRSGMDDYLSKPIDVAALSESLRAAAKFRTSAAQPDAGGGAVGPVG